MQQGRAVSLAGPWRFRTDPERLGDLTPADLVRTADDECAFHLPTYDDSDWQTIPVPGNWQQFGHDYNGVAWYRTRFARPAMPTDGVARLRFAGVDYYADVWLNGFYLGSHEGFFAPFTVDCTPWLAEQNVLVVRVDSPNDVRVKHAREHEREDAHQGRVAGLGCQQSRSQPRRHLGRCDAPPLRAAVHRRACAPMPISPPMPARAAPRSPCA